MYHFPNVPFVYFWALAGFNSTYQRRFQGK